MRFYTELPKKYASEEWNLSPLIDGNPSKRITNALENTLYLYSSLAKKQAKVTDNNSRNFRIKNVFLVGSGAKENRKDSDIDFLLIAQKLDEASSNNLKLSLSYVLFCDRPKREAVDVFIRSKDFYPSRPKFDLTEYFPDLLKKYNNKLIK
ncbi:hypothetical protein KAI04_01295 [Candidatus Pacearchaeota archaeon]|nr:hypothetical protein [Candidatus Pacearchaeota archaeon]